MPVARRHRYRIIETDEVSRALDAAKHRWPGEPRSRLIVRLVTANGESIGEANEAEAASLRAAVRANAGSLSGMYPAGYLDELRSEWPE